MGQSESFAFDKMWLFVFMNLLLSGKINRIPVGLQL